MYFLFLVMIVALASGSNIKPETTSPSILSETTDLRSDDIFENIITVLKANNAEAKTINGVFLCNITNGGKVVKSWTFDLKNGKYYQGPAQNVKVDTTFTISDADVVKIAHGKLNVITAYFTGKLNISGSYLLALKMGRKVQEVKSKLKL